MNRSTVATAVLTAGLTLLAQIGATLPTVAETDPAAHGYFQAALVGEKRKPGIDPTKTSAVVREAGKLEAAKAVPKQPYGAIIARHASQHGVPLALAHAVVRIESNYRPNARGRAGEIGLMQIKPATARSLGYSGGAKGLYDPETNIRYGMKYLAQAHRLGGGDTCGTILRYNAGHGAKRMNRVSAAYCAKVKRHMRGA